MLMSGDYVVLIQGIDDVPDGQICRVLAPDETPVPHQYGGGGWLPVQCWTGYLAWTRQENVVQVSAETAGLEVLFQRGWARSDAERLRF